MIGPSWSPIRPLLAKSDEIRHKFAVNGLERLQGIRQGSTFHSHMNRYILVLIVAAIVIAGLIVVPGAIANGADDGSDPAPGERLMGSITAQDAELDSEVDERAFGEAIATAAAAGNTTALADLIEERIEQNEQRYAELQERLATLETQREEGNLSEGEYRAEIAKLEVERKSLARTTAEAADAANGLPTEVLDERGINVTAIELLHANASELGGQEVREIARGIAGPHVGNASPERPSTSDRMLNQVTRFDDPNRSIDRAEHWVERSERLTERVTERANLFNESPGGPPGEVSDSVWSNLENATTELKLARAAIEDAMTALADGDEEAALEHAVTAATHAMDASESAHAAAADLRGHPGHGTNPNPPRGGGPPGN